MAKIQPFLADRINSRAVFRAIGTLLRLSAVAVVIVVCDVLYCG